MIDNIPDYLRDACRWQSQEDFHAGLGTKPDNPAPHPDSLVHRCKDCGKPIDPPKGLFRTYARCQDCNDKISTPEGQDVTLCKRCHNHKRAWVRGRFANLCEICADDDRKAFTAGNDSLFRKQA